MAVILIGGAILIALLVRMLWPRVRQVVGPGEGGRPDPLAPRAYFLRVVTPEAVSWIASLCVMAIFLNAYNIPVSFHTLMRILAGNSIANVTSVTPGGAGVTRRSTSPR